METELQKLKGHLEVLGVTELGRIGCLPRERSTGMLKRETHFLQLQEMERQSPNGFAILNKDIEEFSSEHTMV